MSEPEIPAPGIAAAFRRLGKRRRGRVPYVQQMAAADCGAACLAMALAYHGRIVTLDQARHATGANRGTDAVKIVRGAAQLGLLGRAMRIDVEEIRHLPPGSILHWDFKHFVVLERSRRTSVDIVDPAFGRRTIPISRFRRHFTGIALSFEPTEEFAPMRPERSKAWSYLVQLFVDPSLVTRILVMSVVLRLLSLALPMLTALVVDRVVPRGDADLLLIIATGVSAMLAFQLFASLIRAHLLIALRTRLDTKMTVGFLSHLLSLPYGYFNERSAGDLLMRVASTSQIRELLTSTLLSTLLDGALALGYLVLLFALSPILAVLTLLASVLQLSVVLLSKRRFAQLAAQDLETQARAQSYLVQMLVGIETLKTAGAEDRALEHWVNLFVDELNVSLSRSRLVAVVDSANGLFQVASPLVLLSVGTLLVLNGNLSLGTMLATTALSTAFLIPVSTLLQSGLQLYRLSSYVERIDDVIKTPPEQKSGMTHPPRLSGKIELKHVSFRYGPNAPFVIRDLSLMIEPGATVAIVGRSGSGKSTLAKLLLGLQELTEGHIFYDGYDLTELDHKQLRQQIGMVPQNPYIFSGSIRNNISLSNPTMELDRIIAAARRACIDDDIRAMTMGYETIIADGGATLSGGQRQRLALARALLLDPSILLLDEATSSLDATTEHLVMDHLRTLRATRIIIAHRLSTVVNADLIIVMKDGAISESGTHDELVRRGGVYAALIADQQVAS